MHIEQWFRLPRRLLAEYLAACCALLVMLPRDEWVRSALIITVGAILVLRAIRPELALSRLQTDEVRAGSKALLRRAGAGEQEIYGFGDAEVDLPRCELRRAGRVVELTPTEFQLLTFFIRTKGRTLSREQLLIEVWEPDVHITGRVIDTHIVNLRKKIEPQPVPEYLVSVRAIGYRFDG